MTAAKTFPYAAALAFLMLGNSLSAQIIKPTQNKYIVKHFGEEEGLLQNSINCILPDKNDFLWIGTETGIMRFNGSRFLPIKNIGQQEKINFTRIKTIYRMSMDTIMAYSRNARKVAFIVKNKIVSIDDQVVEHQGMLFNNMPYAIPAPTYIKGTQSLALKSIGMDDWNIETPNYVGATYNKDTFSVVLSNGIGIYSAKGMICKINIDHINPSNIIFSNHQIIYIDKENYANYYSPHGALQKRKLFAIKAKSPLLFYNNNLGNYFYCVADRILYRINLSTTGDFNILQLISDLQSSANISTIIEKDSNTVVIGTYGSGLYVYKKIYFSTTDLMPDRVSNIFYTQQLLSDGEIIPTKKEPPFNLHTDKTVNGIYLNTYSTIKDKKGDYWYVANHCVLHTHKIGDAPDTAMHIGGAFCFLLLEDKDGRIWLNSGKRFGYIKNGLFTDVKIGGVQLDIITRMEQDSLGKYYIGTHRGVYIWDSINEPNATEIPSLKGYDIMFIWPENSAMIWVCTFGNGVFLVNKDGATSFLGNNGKLAYVHAIAEDSKGYLWMPSFNGLFVTSKQSLLAYAKNKKSAVFFYEFSIKDGLNSNEFICGEEPAFLRLHNGDICFTTISGFVQFPPANVSFEFSNSPILVDEIHLDSTEIDAIDGFDVNSKIRNVVFSISTSFWGTRENEKMEYQVTEKKSSTEIAQWLPVDDRGKINLFSPSYGYYQLIIRKRTGFNAHDYTYKTIDFHVLPKWYQTKTFWTALLLILILIMIGVFSLRRNYYRRANKILKQKVDAATAELQQINSTLEKKVEERTLEIQKSEIKSRTLIERSQVGVYIIQENKFIYVNPRFEELTGYKSDEAIGMNPLLLFAEPEQIIVAEKIRQRMSGEVESDHYEIAGRRKDGTVRQWELLCSRTIYEGKPTLLGTMLDITERAKMQKELREAEMKFRDLVEKSLVGVYITTGKKLVYVNPRYAEMFGYSQNELIGMNAVPITVYEDDKELVEKNIKARMEGKVEGIHYEFRAVKKDGSIMYAEAFGRTTQFEGSPAIIGTIIDITEKKKAEQQLIKEKNLSQSIINNLPGIFYIFNQNLNYLLWNKNFETVTGYSKEELSEIKLGQLTTQENLSSVSKVVGKIFTDGYSETEAILLCKDGKEIPYYFNGITVNYNNEICALGVGFDISERKKAQQERELAIDALQKSEANLNTIFLNTDTVYILLDTELKIIAFNQRAFDYMKKVYNGNLKTNVHFTDYVGHNRRQKFREDALKVMNGKQDSYEKSHLQPNGKYTWYYVRKFPVLHSSKIPLGMMIAISDITEKKLLEQEILDQKIQEQKKVIRAILTGEEKERNKIGQELHDNINQILAGTKLYLSVIEQEKSGNQHLKHSMKLLDSAIDEIQDLSKNKVTPPKRNSLPEMLQILVDNFFAATKIETNFSYAEAELLIEEGLKLNIYRIVQEQLNNIVKHAHAKNVSIKVKVDEKNINLLVTDDGIGFDVESKRTGIGIENMTNRVESFNGTIDIKSILGNGCSIEVNLPV